MGFSIVLQSSSLLLVERWDLRSSSQCIFVRVRQSCFLLVKMCLCHVSLQSRWRSRYFIGLRKLNIIDFNRWEGRTPCSEGDVGRIGFIDFHPPSFERR
jgi:hypothetical protein